MHWPVPAPGSVVWIRQRRWRVERARLDRGVVRLDVADRQERLTFLVPFDRPIAADRRTRPRTVRRQHAAARLAAGLAAAAGRTTPLTAVRADLTIHPHQLEPVVAVLAGVRRVLIADDVGLGKTVQAGLVLSEILAREHSSSVLVMAPAALREQWATELRVRFRLAPMLADREELERLARTGWREDSPWRRPGVWIASLDFLKQAHVRNALPLRPWDLVVVDEAHDACGDSARHEACASILRRARRVLLLTATPHSGDQARFERLIALGHPGGPRDPLTIFRRTREDLGWPVTRRVRWRLVTPSVEEDAVLEALNGFERWMLAEAGDRKRDAALLLLAVFRKRALSTMTALHRSIRRRLDWLDATGDRDTLEWTQGSLGFDEDVADDLDATERAGLSSEVNVPPRLERAWLSRLDLLTTRAIPHQRKVATVVELAARSFHDPMVVFTEFRDSLRVLRERLGDGRVVAELHGGQTPAERAAQLELFLEGRASLLLATDVAGQGLNLQARSRWVLSLELPWNPARLAQRVGRVDRIGQARPVHATMLVTRHPAEGGLLARLARRALTARQGLSGSALEDVAVPGERVMAACLLAGENEVTIPERLATPLATSSLWKRRARAAARLLARKRRLANVWRRPVDPGRPLQVFLRPPAPLCPPAGSALALFSTPIVNAIGEVVEPHALALRVPDSGVQWLFIPQVFEHVAGVARTRLESRVTRVRSATARALAARAEAEAAIDAALRPLAGAVPRQPGLFAGRAPSQWVTAERALEELADDGRARRARDAREADVFAGPPALLLIVRRCR